MRSSIIFTLMFALWAAIAGLASANGKKPEDPIAGVVEVDLENMAAVLDTSTKAVLVEFYAPWCGHCKQIAPEMVLVGATFLQDPTLSERVTLAKIDADKWHELGSTYEVPGYPTILWIPRGGKPADAKTYEGKRTAVGILEFVREEIRALDGYARVSELTDIATKMASGGDAADLLASAKEFTAAADGTAKANAELYVRYMEKFVAKGGMEYVENEIRRLKKLIAEGVSNAKQNEFDRRLSVLTSFSISSDDDDDE